MWSVLVVAALAAAPRATLVAPRSGDVARGAVVVTWDGDDPAAIAVQTPGRPWRTAARRARSPWTSPALPAGTTFRLTLGDTVVALSPPAVLTPADVAAWSGPGLRGARVVDLAVADGRLWAATLGGGLGVWDGRSWSAVTPREGLPGWLAVAVDAQPDATWAATDGGLARVVDQTVAATWDAGDGLPDDYAQAVLADGETVWVGTWRGLARVEDGLARAVLTPWSCFSLIRGNDRRIWVGYEGLRGLPDGEPLEGVDPALRVYDAEPLSKGVWLATDTEGLLWLDEGILAASWLPAHDAVYAIARIGVDHLVLAAGDDGVWELANGVPRAFGVATGLPSPIANEVIPGPPGKVWVGTERGVALLDPAAGAATALPLAPLAAGIGVVAIVPDRRGIAVATDEGLVWVGEAPRGWDALTAATPRPRGLARIGRDWWALTEDAAIRLDARGGVRRWPLPDTPVSVGSLDAGATIALRSGVTAWLPGATQLAALDPFPGLRAATLGSDGAQWLATEDTVVRRDLGGDHTWRTVPGPRDIATQGEVAWVAADAGLYRIDGVVTEASGAWRAGPLVAVATHGLDVWAAGADGRIWGPDPVAPRSWDLAERLPGVVIRALTADAQGVWAATDLGVFRVWR